MPQIPCTDTVTINSNYEVNHWTQYSVSRNSVHNAVLYFKDQGSSHTGKAFKKESRKVGMKS